VTSPPSDPDAIRVLIADDTPDIRLLLGIALKLAGDFEVIGEAENGDVAVTMATQLQPDIVLLDLAMPVKDGLQALPEIVAAVPSAIVVVLSGFGAETMASEAIARGADAYVQKGINPTELTDQLRTLHADRGVGSTR
jgi:DNA-binding NarL/FixJ family response regulator